MFFLLVIHTVYIYFL